MTFEERDGGRFCHSCNELQHDLRDATQREALALIAAKGGRLCGIFRAGPSGEVHFRPETPSRAAQAARGAAMALALAGCGSPSETTSAGSPPSAVPATTTLPPSTVIAAPPTTLIAPPPETLAPLSDAELHATDASADPADHHAHVHTHAPVAIGSGGLAGIGDIGRGHISGGASAIPMDFEGAPNAQLAIAPSRITAAGPGTFDRDVFIRMLRTRQAAIRACYQRELRNVPTLAGEVVIDVTLAPSGAVASASVVSSADGLDAVAACAVRVTRGFRFNPGPEGGAVTYTVPLAFASDAL